MTIDPNSDQTPPSRRRGRPRLPIDNDAVADAVAVLLAKGGVEAVNVPDTAERLGVSRATLYRSMPTKEDLLGVLFERSTRELTERTKAALARIDDPGLQLKELIRLQSAAAVEMRSHMPVFFGGGGLPPDVFKRWRRWSRQFEKLWSSVVEQCMEEGYLDKADPMVATRLILGMIIWVSRWYRPSEGVTAEEIAESAMVLLRLPESPRAAVKRVSAARPRR